MIPFFIKATAFRQNVYKIAYKYDCCFDTASIMQSKSLSYKMKVSMTYVRHVWK